MITVVEVTRLADKKYYVVFDIDGTVVEYYVESLNQLKSLLQEDVLAMPNSEEIIANTDFDALLDEVLAAETGRQTYLDDVHTLEQLTHLIDLGVFTGSETQIVDLRNKIKSEFKLEYLD